MVYFTKDVTQIVLPNPSVPGRKHKGQLQVRNASTSGRIVVSDLGAGSGLRQPLLPWSRLVKATHFAALESFLEDTVHLTELAFSFTDWDGDTYTVRYWSGLEEAEDIGGGRMRVTIHLREVPT